MVRAMLASVVIATLLGMSSIGHAQSGSVDTRDYLAWQRGAKSKSTNALTGTPRQTGKVKRTPKGTVRCAPVGSSRPSAAC